MLSKIRKSEIFQTRIISLVISRNYLHSKYDDILLKMILRKNTGIERSTKEWLM